MAFDYFDGAALTEYGEFLGRQAIKEIRQTSNHLIICSPTASGKTEAAMLPLISELLEKNIYSELDLLN